MHSREEQLQSLSRLLDVMAKLREKCPWNRAQTFESLRPLTLEEVYELSDTVLRRDNAELCKELGDILLHVIFYSRIAEEEGLFDISDVAEKICDKLVYRHPHVFSDVEVADADEVSQNWEMLKTREKGGNKRVLSGVPAALPSLLKAYFMQDKARGVGFDWSDRSEVWAKVDEERREVEAELRAMDAEKGNVDPSVFAPSEDSSDGFKAAYSRAEDELGDYLFTVVNAARLYGLNPDTALSRAAEKFRRRFTSLEENTIRKGIDLHKLSLQELDALWAAAKKQTL